MRGPVGQLDPSCTTVHIWGGGIAGLLLASFLSRRGHHIELYEKSERLGGKVGTEQLPTGLVERGPNAIYATREVLEWLQGLGLAPLRSRTRLRRWIWQQGEPRAPRRRELLKKLLPRLLKEAPRPTPETTVAEFLRPLLGPSGIDDLVSPALQGIYGTTADRLTVLSLWPQLEGRERLAYWKVLKLLKGPRAQSVSFPGGMQEFVDALAKSINGTVHLNHRGPFELKPNTVICTDAHVAADLVEPSWKDGASLLRTISYLPVTSTTLHTSVRMPWSEDGFGVLFPRSEGIRALGCLFNHSIFSGRVQQPARAGLTFIHGSVTDVATGLTSDLQKLDWPRGDLAERSYSYPVGLPLYNEARWSAIRQLHRLPSRPTNFVLFGNYMAGISLRDMIHAASSFAENLGVE